MKSLFLAGAACMAAVLMTGCFSVNTNDASVAAPARINAKTFQADIVASPKKVSGEATLNSILGIFNWGVSDFADNSYLGPTAGSFALFALPIQLFKDPAILVKQGATYQACKNGRADYILGVKYKVDTEDYIVYKRVKCTVTGYPAVLKGVK